MQQTPAKIFLADERGLTGNQAEQRYSTFNDGTYFNEHRQAFRSLHIFNDETLAAGATLTGQAATDGYMVLLPVTGAIKYNHAGETAEADAGEVLLIPVKAGQSFEITNIYTDHWVNFLRLEIDVLNNTSSAIKRSTFNIWGDHNKLVSVISDDALPFAIHIGRFAGRSEALYPVNNNRSGIFSFVLAGAFELQNRLLHERDGLALWEVAEVEAEALSNDAVLLLIELE